MLEQIARRVDVVIPVHPRTAKSLAAFGLAERLEGDGFRSITPVGYIDSITLMSGSQFVLTDSGGIQEETTYLGVPCLTLRGETERPVTVEVGTNLVVSEDCSEVLRCAVSVIEGRAVEGSIPPHWDGKASVRIMDILEERFS
jgi:UDP-N-acetylglucosamine 2-epimerase (non-hydrolysing)